MNGASQRNTSGDPLQRTGAARLIQDNFDFRLAAILRDFHLRHLPAMASGRFYQTLAAYGPFGRTDLEPPWEKTDRADALSAGLG